MRRKLWYFILLSFMLVTPAAGLAQQVKIKNFKEAKNYLKNNKKGEVDKIVGKLTPADSVEKHYLNGMLNKYAYEQNNVKMYYGNKVDTTAVFKTLFNMYEQYEKAYPHIQQNDTYAKPVTGVFQQYQNNLRIGGNYFITRKDYDQAYKFYSLFIRLHQEKLIAPNDSVMNGVYGNAVIAASMSNRLDETVRLAQLAHDSDHDSEDIDFQLCDALRKMNRQEEWVEAVKTAIKHHPEQFAFYGMLIDSYLESKHVEEAMKLADDLLAVNEDNYLNCFVKGYVCQHIQDYDCAVEWLQKVISKKNDYLPALVNLGFSMVERAENVEKSIDHFPFTPEEKEQIKTLYKEAETILEKARKLSPKEPKQWAAPLWKVYYKLNDGEKLEEIEKLLD